MERTNVVSLALIAALAVLSNRPAHAAEITVLVNQGALSVLVHKTGVAL